jgi:hypothetical protein
MSIKLMARGYFEALFQLGFFCGSCFIYLKINIFYLMFLKC